MSVYYGQETLLQLILNLDHHGNIISLQYSDDRSVCSMGVVHVRYLELPYASLIPRIKSWAMDCYPPTELPKQQSWLSSNPKLILEIFFDKMCLEVGRGAERFCKIEH